MKKGIFAIVMLLSAVGLAQTNTAVQEGSASSPQRTIRRVLPQAQLVVSDYQNGNGEFNSRQGWGVGALFDIGTAEHLVLETGALYRQLNAQGSNAFGTTDVTQRYISIPVDAKIYFKGQDYTSLYLKLGGMASTLASRDVTYSPGYAGTPYDWNGRTWEVSALGGLGMKFVLTPASDLFIEADYTRATDSMFNNSTVYNAAWNFGAGVGINL